MKQRFLYAIDSITSETCEIAHGTRDEAKKTWLCPGCVSARQDSEIPSLILKGTVKNIALNAVYGTGIGVIRRDFLRVLESFNASNYIRLTKLLNSAGSEIPAFYGFLPKKYTVIRGDTRSSRRGCEICGRQLYSPMGKWYLLNSEFSDNELLAGDQFSGFILRPEIAEHVKAMGWPEIAITRLPLLDLPLDNLNLDI